MKNYNEYKKIIDENLIKYIPSIDSKVAILRDAMEYSLLAGGKRIRPVLLLASCDFANGNIDEALPYACAIEYIHTYSLIHDDLPAMDNDDLRRGKPTSHKMFGEDIAILTGDALLNTAFEIMMKNIMELHDIDKVRNHIKAIYQIAKNSGIYGMIAGQVADVSNLQNKCDDEIIKFINEGKTARLLQASIISGLNLAGTDEDIINDFDDYAYQLGVSFQIVDDILDITSTSEELGKTIGKDARDDKTNYVNLHGIAEAKKQLKKSTELGLSAISKYDERADFFRTLLVKLEKRTK